MRGKHVFMQSLSDADATQIFGNPGTTENPLLESLSEYPQIHYTTTLHEGIAVCSAGAYAAASGRTGLANVHVAPGLGNAIGMLYGCLKSRLPVLVTAGQQDTRLGLREPLLHHDLVAMATPVTKWAAQPQHADELAPLLRRGLTIANQHPRGPVFLALPNNVMEQNTTVHSEISGEMFSRRGPDTQGVEAIVRALKQAQRIAIFGGDEIGYARAQSLFGQLARHLNADVYIDTIPAQLPLAFSDPYLIGRIPMQRAQVRKLLSDYDTLLMVGGVTMEELWFDAGGPWPENLTTLQIEAEAGMLGTNNPVDIGVAGDLQITMSSICQQLDSAEAVPAARLAHAQQRRTLWQEKCARLADVRPMSVPTAMSALAAALPDNIILVEEAITASDQLAEAFDHLPAENFYASRGGGIGQGLGGVIGTAVAHDQAPVAVISGDGSAMYSIQALWSAAHHGLNILFIILANSEYRVLKHNIDVHRQRFDTPSQAPYPHMDLQSPTLDFVSMGNSMGVPGQNITDPAEVANAVNAAMATNGPYLIELTIAGKR